MIEFLFSVLLIPVLPELADPSDNHSVAIKEIDRRLSRSRENASPSIQGSTVGATPETSSLEAPDLPIITGGLFEWSSTKPINTEGEETAGGLSTASLRLTGLIDISGQRVAILSDGEKDHVVGVGSYVLNTYQVVALGSRNAVLKPLDQGSGGARLELNLMADDLPRGF